ncbi:MAG TPA: CYTH domain-containing protein [Trebonia sp.]|nr:CYTH domain-containing protein [Trebonia sp.]
MAAFEDYLEVEFKFIPDETEGDAVAWFTDMFAPSYGFAKWPPCANLDIYLDTPDLRLYRANTPLRLRRWATPFKLKQGISANFKYPADPGEGLRRRELKTILSEDQAWQVCNGRIVGETLEHAARSLGLSQGKPILFSPTAVISTLQTLYVLRPRALGGATALARGKESDLLLLTFEHCTVHEAPGPDLRRFLRNGMLDVDPARPTAEFFEAELEIVALPDYFEHAEELYLKAFYAVRGRGNQMPSRSKYTAAINGIHGLDDAIDAIPRMDGPPGEQQ